MEPLNEPPEPISPAIEPRPEPREFPLRRNESTLTDLLSRASEAWSRDLGAWVLAMLLYGLIGLGVPMVLGLVWGVVGGFQDSGSDAFQAIDWLVQGVLQVAQLVLGAIFTLGLWAMAMRGLHAEKVTVGVLFSQLSKIWKYVLQALAVFAGVLLIVAPLLLIVFLAFVGPVDRSTPMDEITDKAGMPLLIAFGVLVPLYVYIVAGIAFMQTELAFNDDSGPVEAILTSWRIARGKRGKIIGVGLLAILIWTGSTMLCGIGLLFGGPFATLLVGALYLALRNGSDAPAPNTTSTLGRRY
jgi:hypothetical protein